MSVGEIIRDRRLALGMTQRDLSDRLGLGQKTISDIERTKSRAPRLETLRQIAKVLDLDIAQLVVAAEVARGDMAKEIAARYEDARPIEHERDPMEDAMLFEFRHMDEAGRLLLLEQARLLKKWQADVERMKPD